MDQTKSLVGKLAIEKIQDLAQEEMCLFCTYENGRIVSRPMSTQKIEDDGSIWFFSRKGSDKNEQINVEDRVYLMYMNNSKQHYLSLSGHAEILVDRKKIEELWTPMVKTWFQEGKDDPEITLIRVMPEDGHYWDTKNGRLVSMLKIAAALVSGKEMDGMIDGDLKV